MNCWKAAEAKYGSDIQPIDNILETMTQKNKQLMRNENKTILGYNGPFRLLLSTIRGLVNMNCNTKYIFFI
jgi:hypothetical protein